MFRKTITALLEAGNENTASAAIFAAIAMGFGLLGNVSTAVHYCLWWEEDSGEGRLYRWTLGILGSLVVSPQVEHVALLYCIIVCCLDRLCPFF